MARAPARLAVRSATPRDIDAIARVHVAGWQESYRGLLPDEVIDARTFERRQTMWSQALGEPNRVTFVAEEDADGIVAFASAVVLDPPIGGYSGYLQTIYMFDRVKGKGVGRALLAATAQALLARGCTNMVLRTLRLGPARGFYERTGARLLPEGLPLDNDEFDDVAYAFEDLRRFDTSA
jgi:GNAT superfamily N-acetyltransferase